MDEKLRILLCEDDENLGMLLREYLQTKGYSAELCPDGEAGYKAFLRNKYDLCVLDVMMPKKDGWQVCREIREISPKPVIMITAKGEVFDKLSALNELAKSHGVVLCHENEAKIYGDIPTRVREIYDAFGGDIKTVFDMGNYVLEGVEPVSEERIAEIEQVYREKYGA